jgi:hypothetical protein
LKTGFYLLLHLLNIVNRKINRRFSPPTAIISPKGFGCRAGGKEMDAPHMRSIRIGILFAILLSASNRHCQGLTGIKCPLATASDRLGTMQAVFQSSHCLRQTIHRICQRNAKVTFPILPVHRTRNHPYRNLFQDI